MRLRESEEGRRAGPRRLTGARDPSQNEKGGRDLVPTVVGEMAPADGLEDVERRMGPVKVPKERGKG